MSFCILKKGERKNQSKFQHFLYALITVIITVHAFVFYSLFVVEAEMSMTNTSSVPEAIKAMGGVMVFGQMVPVWAVIALEFVLALSLEVFMGAPCSHKLTVKVFDPKTSHPVLFEAALICATAALMSPTMSLLAAFIYYPYGYGFDLFKLFCNWFSLICHNLPFALLSQLFFIQPICGPFSKPSTPPRMPLRKSNFLNF